MSKLFKSKDPQVQEDASNLSKEDFLAKYSGQTTEAVLEKVWTTANGSKKKAKVSDETIVTPVSEFVVEDGAKVTVKKVNNSTVVETEEPDEVKPTKDSKKEKKEKDPGQNVPTMTRAARLRELIAAGNDKALSKSILQAEGYDVGASFHSEWNRLNK